MDRRGREADKQIRKEMRKKANQSGKQVIMHQTEKESRRQINLILQSGITWEQGKELGYFHKTAKYIKLNQLGQAYAGQLTLAQQGGSQAGASSSQQQYYHDEDDDDDYEDYEDFDDDTDDDDAYELAPSTPRGPAYPTGDEANNALDHLLLNYSEDSLIRAGYVDLTSSTSGGSQIRLLHAGVDRYRDDMKMVVPATHPKFKVASDYCEKNFPNPMFMFNSRYQQKIVKLLTTEGLKKYEEAEKSAVASAQPERTRLSEVVPKPSKDYETAIKKSLEDWEKQLIEYLNQVKTQNLTIQSIESLNNIVNGIIDYLTKVLSDKIAFDTTVGRDLRIYLDNLIQKGVNEKLYKMLRMVMNQCIIPPLPRGKKYGDFDVGTQNLYDIAYNLYRFVLAYLPLSQKLPYVKLGNIEETMKNWKIWYDDQDDPDDAQYKGLDISGYIIKHGKFPTTLNVESMQAVEQPISSGTTYRINFYYPNPWEASGTIKYFDVVLA